ncbi:MAG: tetratricopeptide repeat protein, partial [Bdellovibrionota bacterium]
EIVVEDEESDASKNAKVSELGGMNAEQSLDAARKAFENKQFSTAVEFAKRSRLANPENVAAWLTEIRALRAAGNEDLARKTAKDLFEERPETKSLPFLKFALVE